MSTRHVMQPEIENPYRTPETSASPPLTSVDATSDQPTAVKFVKKLAKWSLICSICATPSFVIACLATVGKTSQVIAMLVAVALFSVGYALLELAPVTQQALAEKRNRVVARVGYGTRLGITFLYPIAVYLDVICGLLTVAIVQAMGLDPDHSGIAGDFLFHFVTTIAQGFVLNIVLFAYMLIVYASTFLFPKRYFA